MINLEGLRWCHYFVSVFSDVIIWQEGSGGRYCTYSFGTAQIKKRGEYA